MTKFACTCNAVETQENIDESNLFDVRLNKNFLIFNHIAGESKLGHNIHNRYLYEYTKYGFLKVLILGISETSSL